ncbi:MAG: Crp/Fnr family transcriptional regulator [Leptolyngbyaceae bacterium]|nr:Crp/Fnr family transcriptional regulator [Leptolyngbyaceae bacterium]
MRSNPSKQTTSNPKTPLNLLLAALPEEEYARLASRLREVHWTLGQVIYEPNEVISTVYFPNQAMISLVQIMEDGSTVEAGIVGNDGMLGYPVYLGGQSMSSRAIVQIAGSAIALDATVLKSEFRRGEALHDILLLYTQAFLAQLSQTAACNQFHPVEERLARWLLQSRDFAQSNTLRLTQDFLASMLGTRRASVTVAAGTLQQAGLIQYSRGHIEILDSEGLESATCECYAVVQDEYRRLLDNLICE